MADDDEKITYHATEPETDHHGAGLAPKSRRGGRFSMHSSHKGGNCALLFCFIVALGCSIAPLTATYKGWAYKKVDHFYFKQGVLPAQLTPLLPVIATPAQIQALATQYTVPGVGFYFQFWVGWIKGTSTLRQWPNLSFIQCRNINFTQVGAALGPVQGPQAVSGLSSVCLNQYKYLKEESHAAQVWAGFTGGFLALGGFTAFIFALLALLPCFSAKEHLCFRRFWWISLTWGIIYFVFVCGLYIFLAVGIHNEVQSQLQWSLIPRPDWAFFVAIVASFAWLAAAVTQFGMPRTGAHTGPAGVNPGGYDVGGMKAHDVPKV